MLKGDIENAVSMCGENITVDQKYHPKVECLRHWDTNSILVTKAKMNHIRIDLIDINRGIFGRCGQNLVLSTKPCSFHAAKMSSD